MSLQEIARFVQLAHQGDHTLKERVELLKDHRERIVSRMAEMQRYLDKITWKADTPPVSLHVANAKPEVLEEIKPEMNWFVSSDISDTLRPILERVLTYTPADARHQANSIGHQPETFAGIYSTRTAESIMKNFQDAAVQAGLPLTIRMQEVRYE